VTPPSRGGAVSSKQVSDSSSSSAMELLQQPSHQYHGKSPAVRGRSLHCHIHTAAHSVTPLMFVFPHTIDLMSPTDGKTPQAGIKREANTTGSKGLISACKS